MSGLSLSVPVDEDWQLSTSEGDAGDAEVTFCDNATGSDLTLRGPTDKLVDLLETALADLVDYKVGARTDAKLASLAEVTERAIATVSDAILQPERLLTADEMTAGGWVRLIPSPVWHQVASVTRCPSTAQLVSFPHADRLACRRIDFVGVTRDPAHVSPATTYPYMSDAEFQATCDRRTDSQAKEDEVDDRLAYHERVQELRAERDELRGGDAA